jgi:hypothetical protein
MAIPVVKLKIPSEFDCCWKGSYKNTLERFHAYNATKQGIQMIEMCVDTVSPIIDILITTDNT